MSDNLDLAIGPFNDVSLWNAATPHADIQEAEDIVPVPEPREAGPEGVILCNAGK